MLELHGLWSALLLALVMLGVAWAVRRSTSTTLDFYLARRQVGPLLNAGAICGDYFSAASFLGVAGSVYASGLDGVWFATGFSAGFVVVLLFLAAPLRRAGQFSIPDFLATRFSSQGVRLAAVAIVQLVVFVYLIPQMVGAGLTWEVLVGSGLPGMSPYGTGVLLTTVAMAAHAVLGGMRATTWNQALQFGLMLFTVLFLALLVSARGFSYPESLERLSRGVLSRPVTVPPDWLLDDRHGPSRLELVRSVMTGPGYQRVLEDLRRGDDGVAVLLPATNRLHPDRPAVFGQPGQRYGLWDQLALLITLLLGTAGLPHIVNRYFTSTSGRAARRSTVWVLALAAAFYSLAVMLGVAARSQLPRLLPEGATDSHFIDGVVRDPEQALLWLARELGGAPLLALVGVAALAAILSTMAGLFIAAAVSWGHDVYEQFINPGASQSRRILLGRVAVVVTASVAGIAGLWVGGLYPRPPVALMVTWAFAVAGSAFTPVFLLSVWWRRMTPSGAIAGMTTGSLLAVGLIVVDLAGGTGPAADLSVASFPGAVAAPVAAAVSVAVSVSARRWGEPVGQWVRMHGTAVERRQSLLARLAARGEPW